MASRGGCELLALGSPACAGVDLSRSRTARAHAWPRGVSNLHLRRHGDQLTLSVEHRAAASVSTVQLLLDTAEGAVALRTLDHGAGATEPATAELSLEQHLVEHLTRLQRR